MAAHAGGAERVSVAALEQTFAARNALYDAAGEPDRRGQALSRRRSRSRPPPQLSVTNKLLRRPDALAKKRARVAPRLVRLLKRVSKAFRTICALSAMAVLPR